MYRYLLFDADHHSVHLGTAEYAVLINHGETIEALGRRRFFVVAVVPNEVEGAAFIGVLRVRELE